MVQYESFQTTAIEPTGFRRWIIGGLLLSLALHAGLLAFFYGHQMKGFGSAADLPAAPIKVKMVRVAVPEEVLSDPQKAVISDKSEMKAPITLPSERPAVEEISIAPQIPEMPKQTFEKPKVDMAGLDKLVKNDVTARAEMDRELNNIAQAIIKDSPRAPRQPIIPLGSSRGAGAEGGTDNVKIPGLDSIDDQLGKAGGAMKAGTRTGMPGGALFEYDSYELREEAVGQLRKLGLLIEKNPKATFLIEGHTDSFGSPEYNLKLSENRAESVKNWLVQFLRIAPERIQTRGFGNTRPLVTADKSMEEQAPNRRVELVVRTNPGKK